MNGEVSVVLWNVEWAKPGRHRGNLVSSHISAANPQLICLTEGYADLAPAEGHVLTSSADYGYPRIDDRRKVVLWSKSTWEEATTEISDAMPGGRFTSGVTATSIGRVRVVGVCIPWKDAHVRTGRKDRRPWEDHVQYLTELGRWLATLHRNLPVLLLGDFNQRIPRCTQPLSVFEALTGALPVEWPIPTQGAITGRSDLAIDHLAHTPDLEAEISSVISGQDLDGTHLSDHFGFVLRMRQRS